MTATSVSSHQKSGPVVETALDWWQRSKRQRAIDEIPTDSAGAAWYFVRKDTGMEFMNAAFCVRATQNAHDKLPIIEVAGDEGTSIALLTLAANFVVATRPSQFFPSEKSSGVDNIPRVILLDSIHQITTKSIYQVVRSTLLRKINASHNEFESDLTDCLSRIHVCTVSSTSDWVSLLELFRSRLSTTQHPTLLLWNGFLNDLFNEAAIVEVVRQLQRLIERTSVVVVTTANSTTGWSSHASWRKLLTQQVRLERMRNDGDGSSHNFAAHVSGKQYHFSLSREGIFS